MSKWIRYVLPTVYMCKIDIKLILSDFFHGYIFTSILFGYKVEDIYTLNLE